MTLFNGDLIQAGIYRNSGKPVLKGNNSRILGNFLKHSDENFLRQILLAFQRRQMSTYNFHHEGSHGPNQYACRSLVAQLNSLQAQGDIDDA